MAEKTRETVKSENSEVRAERPRRQERSEHSRESESVDQQNPEKDVRKENEASEADYQPRSDVRRESRKVGKDDNVVFVGKKPAMAYVLAVITQFSDGNNEVFVKARGRSISRAVDVIEVVKKKFLQDVRCEMETDTEVITDERNQRINVSTFSAKLFK